MAQLRREQRRAVLDRARELFNAGEYWPAHEALETVWRSIISDAAAPVWQGLIQAAAGLLHLQRGNRDGVGGGGGGGARKNTGAARPEVGIWTADFLRSLVCAL